MDNCHETVAGTNIKDYIKSMTNIGGKCVAVIGWTCKCGIGPQRDICITGRTGGLSTQRMLLSPFEQNFCAAEIDQYTNLLR